MFDRLIKLEVKIFKAVDEYFAEIKRIKETGSFEEIWDEFISDPNDK
jgi:hypothetical protein